MLAEPKENLPLISVIVPVYNGESYLRSCIESIENQTYQKLEIIIINDGSTDGTGKVCVELKETYENIRIITMEDEGVSAARNAGLDQAKGALITFVDADDRLRPRTLEVLADVLRKTGSDMAGCSFHAWSTEEEWEAFLTERFRIGEPVTYTGAQYLREELLQGNSRCWSKLYRRSLIGKLRFQRGLSIGEDMLFLTELLGYARKVSEIDYPGYGYYQNAKGAMNRPFTPSYMDQITCWELARDRILAIDSTLEAKVTSILIMGIMLTVGKLAMLPAADRRKNAQYIQICRDKLKQELQVSGAYELLSGGYRLKAKLFAAASGLYLYGYHFRKYKG